MKTKLTLLISVLAASLFLGGCASTLKEPPIPQAVKFNGHWYAVLPEKCDWETANKKCERLGGHLAYVETQEENSFILGLTEKFGVTSHGIWLGGTDEKDEGDWLWLNGKPIINAFWAGGQPGPGNYLVMFCGKSAQSIKGEWGVDISKGLSPVVCEWE